MVGLDTNILLRFIVQDDSQQAKQAKELIFSKEILFISNTVIAETIWSLRRCYQWERTEIVILLDTLLTIGNFAFEDKASISHATWAYRNGGDWSDHLIQAQCQKHHCTSLATFDRKLAQFYPDFVKLLS